MKIVHIFFTLMAGIPATLLGSSLISIFPHMPKPIYYILVLGIPIGGGYFIWKRLRQNYIDMDAAEDMPSYLHEQTMFYLVIGSIIGSLLQAGSNRTAFYLDNGTSREITLNIVKEGAFKVPAKQHLHVSVVMGENVIEYEGKTKKFNLDKQSKWIFNIDTQNVYLLADINYSNLNVMYRDGVMPNNNAPDAQSTIIKEELFQTTAEYLFDAPQTITVRKRDMQDNISKKVLWRFGGKNSPFQLMPAKKDSLN